MSRTRRWAAVVCGLAAGATGVLGGDGIVLQMTGDVATVQTLVWTGGSPNFLVSRGTDPATLTAVENLRAVTGSFAWTEEPSRPQPGETYYYEVTETALAAGTFPDAWISGEQCATDPLIQVHAYNADTYILRQSLCTSFEGPFMYLLFGDDKVLMQDTGDGGIPIGSTVYDIIDDWLFANGKTSIDLVVTHSHAHGDHTQGDGQFQGQPDTTVVGLSPTAVASFFGITDWPNEIVEYDLGGGRILDVIPIPGHQSAHIALYDRRTGLLFTGDTLYSGRCYIFQSFPLYNASIQRMVDFVEDKPVVWVLGTHIEMTNTPFQDFPFGATMHPDEHPLELDRAHLVELLEGVDAMADDPFIEVHAEFIIYPF